MVYSTELQVFQIKYSQFSNLNVFNLSRIIIRINIIQDFIHFRNRFDANQKSTINIYKKIQPAEQFEHVSHKHFDFTIHFLNRPFSQPFNR